MGNLGLAGRVTFGTYPVRKVRRSELLLPRELLDWAGVAATPEWPSDAASDSGCGCVFQVLVSKRGSLEKFGGWPRVF